MTLEAISDKIIKALPPVYLLVILLNIVFLAVTAYSFQHNSEARNEMLGKIIDTCLRHT